MKKSDFYVLPLLLAAGVLVACGGEKSPSDAVGTEATSVPPPPVGACQEPRPQACTMQYDPVCGYGETLQRTYSNACSACADPAIKGWVREAC